MGWLWHRRLAHVGMKNLHKLLKGEHVLGLTNVCFEKDKPCAACQAGKQVGSTHHSKNVMTTLRPLELLHIAAHSFPTRRSSDLEDVHLLRQEQGFPGYDYLWRWEPRQG